MNIEPDIFDYLETTSLEPHDDYTSEITYKDQKIIWNKLKEKDREIERLNNIINEFDDFITNVDSHINLGDESEEFILVRDKWLELQELKGVGKE